MMYSISKDFTFSASHILRDLPDGHPCGRLHGHNYTVRVSLLSDALDAVGFILDYGALAPFGEWLDANCDHQHLNNVMHGNPTAERMARWFQEKVRTLVDLPPGTSVAVGVSETPKTWAWWSA